MNEDQTKAVKALEAAVRKAQRAGIELKVTYHLSLEDGSSVDVTILNGDKV